MTFYPLCDTLTIERHARATDQPKYSHKPMRHNFEESRQARIERLENAAERANNEAERSFKRADDLSQAFWGGQPILVGHHSENRARNCQKKMHNAMRAGLDLADKAKEYKGKAFSAASNTAIFSDDPNASEKLAEKIERLEHRQTMMREANKLCKKNDIEGLTEMGFSPSSINRMLNPTYSYESKGFQSWELSNNSANIRRLKDRLEKQVALESAETSESVVNGITILNNVEANRTQIFFEGKPSDAIRSELKSCGFRWSPSEGAWQRHLSNDAKYHAERIAKMV